MKKRIGLLLILILAFSISVAAKDATRLDLAKALYAECGGKAIPTQTVFSDVEEDHDAVNWCLWSGLLFGTSEDTFSPHASITKEQLATVLWRLSDCPLPPMGEVSASDWAKSGVAYVINAGWLDGEALSDAVSEEEVRKAIAFVKDTEGYKNRTRMEAPAVTAIIPADSTWTKNYQEKTTEKSGVCEFEDWNLKISYQSRFFGHDSAIDRDFIQYGWNFDYGRINTEISLQGCFAADFTGDRYSDMIGYEDGFLICYPLIAENKNGKAVAGKSSKLSLGEKTAVYVGLDAKLCGVGDFNGDQYSDAYLQTEDGTVYAVLGGKHNMSLGNIGVFSEQVLFADIDGDGKDDALEYTQTQVTALLQENGSFVKTEAFTPVLPMGKVLLKDINTDKRADLLSVVPNEEGYYVLYSLFGHGDGRFGPRDKSQQGNTNLYGMFTTRFNAFEDIIAADFTADGNTDVYFVDDKPMKYILISREAEAYDYSMDVLKMEDGYRLYAGGRWHDHSDAMVNSVHNGNGDGDHVMLYTSKDGRNWARYLDGPMFYLGGELGLPHEWWSANTLEPEVIYVDGVYHMFWQCSGVTPKGHYGDRIGYAQSTDGVHFTRKLDRQVLVCDNPEVAFSHQEVIYVPDDPDGKPWWMYVTHYTEGRFHGYTRIRSNDPTTFDYNDRSDYVGFGQIGNQTGYVSNYDGKGGRLFLRITFAESEVDGVKINAPVLQMSKNGIDWRYVDGLSLASTDVHDPFCEDNLNNYFLGFSTINGTGEMERTEDGKIKLYYVSTTASSSVAPQIFLSEGGVGELLLSIETLTKTEN